MIPENIIFSPGMTGPQCQSISITDDSILENDEVFVVALSTTDVDVVLRPRTTSVIIVNDDGISLLNIIIVVYILNQLALS